MSIGILVLVGITAFFTSILSGILGMGGGITLLGVMTLLMSPVEVVPIHGVVQLFSNSTRTLVFLKHVRWRFFLTYAPPAPKRAPGGGRRQSRSLRIKM